MKRSTASRNKTAALKVKQVMTKNSTRSPIKKAPAKSKSTDISNKRMVVLKKSGAGLRPKLKAEILNVYNEAWEAYLKGDLKTHGFHLSNNFKIIGSSEAEQFDSKKEWLAYCKKTIKQYAGVVQLQNRKIKLVPAGEEVMVVENSDIYVLMNTKWTFYSKIRITALLQKEKIGWKYIHQHGSLPDARANEGEVIATAQIKKENLLLKEAVTRRTIELESKNRELEIEASLEKVRAQALGMRKSEDLLDICSILYNELDSLGFNTLRNTVVHVFHDKRECFTDYEYSNSTGGNITTIPYRGDRIIERFIKKIRKSESAFVELKVAGNELNDWKSFRKKTGQVKDTRLKHAKSIHYYIYSVGHASIGISSFDAIENDKKELLKRFRNVFDFAYRRYTDIALAQAQAREAQIEAALERVRSRSMAMHKSNELKDVIKVVLEQFVQLNINVGHAGFYIDYKAHDDMHIWLADPNIEPFFAVIPYFNTPTWNSFNEAKARGTMLHTDLLDFKTKNKFYKSLFKLFTVPEEAQQFYMQCIGLAVSTVLLENVGLYIENFSAIPYTDEENEILIRFGKVFQQTYTRFLDLQKAEAQAREAEIQLALERVRARTMAMQKSEELAETASILFQQVKVLGIESYTSGFTIWENNNTELVSWTSNADGSINPPFRMPARENKWHHRQLQSWRNKEEYVIGDFSGNDMQDYYAYLRSFPLLNEAFKKSEASGVETPLRQVHNVFNFAHGNLLFITLEPVPESYDIFKRFAKTFEQAYTRFIDLQKAESQARESQIQLALERVRARTMAMQSSGELAEVSHLLNKQVVELGIPTRGCAFNIYGENDSTEWFSNLEGTLPSYKTPRENIFLKYYEAGQHGETLLIEEFDKKRIKHHYDYLHSLHLLGNDDDVVEKIRNAMPDSQIDHVAYFKYGYLLFITLAPAPEAHDIFKRFAKEFEQTYTRFLDLQKAEAQAREAEIQLALERVRARSLAMHHTSELQDVVNIAAQQLNSIGMDINGGVFIAINSEVDSELSIWASGGMADYVCKVNVPPLTKPIFTNLLNAIKTGNQFLIETYSDNEKREMFTHLFKYEPWNSLTNERKRELMYREGGFARSVVISQYTTISITNHHGKAFSENENNILKRFGNVFEQSYIRFLDLQKAEAQAREAHIEAALERVRSCAMAMHSSKELNEVVHELRKQMGILGQKNLETCVIHLYDELPDYIQSWAAIKPPAEEGEILESIANVPKKGLMIIEEALGNYLANKGDYVIINQEEKLKQWFSFLVKESPDGFTKLAESVNGNVEELRAYWSFADFSGGSLLMVTRDEPDEPTRALLRRFSNVFGLAYRRFADLKQAEAQTREAQIEAALERVRAQTMAMHSSEDMGKCILKMFAELTALGVDEGTRFGIGILNHDNENNQLWTAKKNGDEVKMHIGNLDMTLHPLLISARKAWKAQVPFHQYVLQGEDLLQYYQMLNNAPDYKIQIPLEKLPEKEIQYCFIFEHGFFYAFTAIEFHSNLLNIIQRFSLLFAQTYRRYLDLVRAEAQAREAQIEAALEKVRSRTMAMQSSEELADAAYVLFEQLNILGVTHERINIGIVNEQNQTIDFWVTEQGGEKLNTKFSGRITEPTTLSKAYEAWRRGEKSLMVDLKGEDLKRWLKYMNEEIKIPFNNAFLHDRRVQTAGFFSKGMLVVTSPEPLQEEALYLLEKFAVVFDLTYTRFSDLKIAEAHALQAEQDLIAIKEAKQKAEIALSELQNTQKQLIHAEKMASLGELTAGIAHEIQNPLNFVNNFSEVSNELIEEIEEERAKHPESRDENLVSEILSDIRQNLQKINHHGKRADAIVKGMLQHSRSSSGQKELTDMNALCDEYLRLSYHGLRAKDKSFNAKFETHLDPTLPKINVVPQDIGRVILNLINNAFYAVSEKSKVESKKSDSAYEPSVTVSTKATGDKILISVKDNGNGIPEHIKEKIFQPFFTTKPTGQGTGLGLSLSYDIVKAHGGELKVETKVGESTKFIIHLPIA